MNTTVEPSTVARTEALLRERRGSVHARTDRLFAGLFAFQWLAAIAIALWISPTVWPGNTSDIHAPAWAAIGLGGAIAALPIGLALALPGRAPTRHVVGIAQMLMGALLIHLTQGRIETHFHVFGSLAFLAFYRDWRVLVSASVVVVADHYLRGTYWPQSLFGLESSHSWRWAEHAGWVVLCDVFLIRACYRGALEMTALATNQAELEAVNTTIERRIAERTRDLADSEARKSAILVTALDAIIVADGATLITEFNPAAEALLGCAAEEAIGTSLTRFAKVAELDESNLIEALQQCSPTVVGRRVEAEGVHADGTKFPAELAITAVNLEGQRAFTAYLRDISDHNRSDDATREAISAVRSASQAKSEFLANMSHELRTPMNGIIGMATLALDTDLQPEQRDYIEIVKSSGEWLLGILNDLLDFSCIEAGRIDLRIAPFLLRETLADRLRVLSTRAHGKGLELVVRVAPDVPDAVVGDVQRVGQVILNVVGNSIRFTEHGEVVVDLRCEESESELLHFTVTDTGIGIPTDRLEAVFEPFVQADGSSARVHGGAGLGLSISRRLVGAMGGRIWLESEIGRGTNVHFTVALPRIPAATAPSTVPSHGLHTGAALLVDDNTASRQSLEVMLASSGLTPVCAASAGDAWDILRNPDGDMAPFGVVIVDEFMPDVGGVELTRRIRNEATLANSKVVLLRSPGSTDSPVPERALAIDGYLNKPVRASDLHSVLDAILGGSRVPEAIPSKPAPAPAPTMRQPRIRLLLAEDHPVNEKLAVRLLHKRGFDVVVARDGLAALERLQTESFDIVLMDIQLPGMNGIEVTDAIRRGETLAEKSVPVIALTAHALRGDRERILAAGLDDYVSKPIRISELYGAIDRAIANRAITTATASQPTE